MADYSNLSASEYLSLMSGESSLRSAMENEANTWRQFTNRPTNFSLGSSGTSSMLKSFMSQRDEEILAEILKQQREAINSVDPQKRLELGDISKWSAWFSKQQGFPAEYGARARAAYESMSDQFRTGQLHTGVMRKQTLDIEAAEHDVLLEAGEIESQELDIKKKKADLAQGKTRVFNRGNEIITEVFKDGRWVFYSSAPRWDAETDTTKQQDFRFYIDQENEARAKDKLPPLTDREEADIFNKYFLKEQIETREAYTPSMVKDLSTKKIAFLNSRDLSLSMLSLLGKSDTLVGGIQSFFGGLNNIAGQWRQAADMFGESELANNKKLYTWDAPEMGDVLQSNLMALAYSLARSFEDEGGRLSKEDVQHQLDILTAGRQSKSRMAAVLFDTHNRSLSRLKNQYLTSKDAKTPGTERSWKDYQAFIRTGPLLIRTYKGVTGAGFWVDVIGQDGKAVVDEKTGKRKRRFAVLAGATWPAGS